MRAPGLYPGVPEAEYHADDALSQSGAKLLLDAPARYQWDRDRPHEPSEAQELGGGTEASVSARLRDMRREKYGAHKVHRQHLAHGLWLYLLEVAK